MHRLAPLLFIGGLLLLATSLGAPAAPVTRAPIPAPAAYFDAQQSAVLTQVAAEAARLRSRLEQEPDAPVASRDPFRFGDVPEPAVPTDAPAPVDDVLDVAPPPMLPRLVAITSAATDDGAVRRAFLAYGGSVVHVDPGAEVGAFVVESIGVTVIELRHRDSGEVTLLRLR